MGSYLLAALTGIAVGGTELISRYKDAPGKALFCLPALGYVAINAAAAVGALGLIDTFNWTFGATLGTAALRGTQVLVAGFGSVALFRSSLMNVKVGDKDVVVGPSGLLQVLLSAADRAVDRRRGIARTAILKVMEGVDFEKAKSALPAYCLALMQNLPPEDQKALASQIKSIQEAVDITPTVKASLLGLSLIDI